MSKQNIHKAVMTLVDLLPTQERYYNYNKSADEMHDVMLKANVGKIVRAFISAYNAVQDDINKDERTNALNKKLLAEGYEFNKTEKGKMVKTARSIQSGKKYLAEWTEAIAEFEALADEFDIQIKQKHTQTSAEVGEDLSDQALLKEMETAELS